MKKAEFIQEVTNIAKENGAKVSQEAVKQVMDSMEVVIAQVVEARDVVNICGMKIGTREVAAKEGIINMDGARKGEKWTSSAKIIPTIKFLDSKKNELSKEV